MKGTLIVLEGLDGSGKATQARLLCQYLRQTGREARAISFPNYESDSSALVRMYLGGAFGSDPDGVNAYAASSFYAVDRYAGYQADWGAFYRAGGILVADRYTTSNAVHQCSKLERRAWDGFLEWLFHYEYELLGIPSPDLVLYLQVEPRVSQGLLEQRYHGDESRKDIHERNTGYLQRSRSAADYCAARLGWQPIACTRGEDMRSRASISGDVCAAVEALLRKKENR